MFERRMYEYHDFNDCNEIQILARMSANKAISNANRNLLLDIMNNPEKFPRVLLANEVANVCKNRNKESQVKFEYDLIRWIVAEKKNILLPGSVIIFNGI